MQGTHRFDLAFTAPNGTEPEIIFIINQQHLSEFKDRVLTLAERAREHFKTYHREQREFIPFVEDLFSTNFGFGSCGYITCDGQDVLVRVRLGNKAAARNATATICIVAMALGSPFKEGLSSNHQQDVSLFTNAEDRAGGWGHAVSGYLSGAVMGWLRTYARTRTSVEDRDDRTELPPEVTIAMVTAWKAVTSRDLREYSTHPHINGWIRRTGAFSLICWGDAADLSVYPDHVHSDQDELTQFSCHNLDTAEQQLTLLAGLAMLCQLARESS